MKESNKKNKNVNKFFHGNVEKNVRTFCFKLWMDVLKSMSV
jgi:hypothetical protein